MDGARSQPRRRQSVDPFPTEAQTSDVSHATGSRRTQEQDVEVGPHDPSASDPGLRSQGATGASSDATLFQLGIAGYNVLSVCDSKRALARHKRRAKGPLLRAQFAGAGIRLAVVVG